MDQRSRSVHTQTVHLVSDGIEYVHWSMCTGVLHWSMCTGVCALELLDVVCTFSSPTKTKKTFQKSKPRLQAREIIATVILRFKDLFKYIFVWLTVFPQLSC